MGTFIVRYHLNARVSLRLSSSVPVKLVTGDTMFASTGTDEVFSLPLPVDGWWGLRCACKPSPFIKIHKQDYKQTQLGRGAWRRAGRESSRAITFFTTGGASPEYRFLFRK